MGINYSPRIITEGLRVAYDVLNPKGMNASSLINLTQEGNPGGTVATVADPIAGNCINLAAGSTAMTASITPNINKNSWTLMWFGRSNTSASIGNYRALLQLTETTYSTYFYLIDNRTTTDTYPLGYQKDESIANWLSHNWGMNQTLWLTGAWQCFATTHNNKVFKTYRNGILVQTQTQTLNVDTYGNIKELTVNGSGSESVRLGPTLLYDYTLNDAEIMQNFNALRGRFGL
jgi:hypothetical protein